MERTEDALVTHTAHAAARIAPAVRVGFDANSVGADVPGNLEVVGFQMEVLAVVDMNLVDLVAIRKDLDPVDKDLVVANAVPDRLLVDHAAAAVLEGPSGP